MKGESMAKPGRATQAKRNREIAKQDKQKDKVERRTLRKTQKAQVLVEFSASNEDPDLIGIIPGPQAPFAER